MLNIENMGYMDNKKYYCCKCIKKIIQDDQQYKNQNNKITERSDKDSSG